MQVRRDFWKAEGQAAEVLATRKIQALPVDPFAIANGEGIVCEKIPSASPGVSGCLMNKDGNFGIFYGDYFSSAGFCRFTVAHELGHYFLEGHYKHIFPDGKGRHESDSGFSSDDQYEREADAFAAALLMPGMLFRAACDRVQPGLKAIETLAEQCGTSLTATAIRYVILSDDPVTVVCSKNNRVQFAVMHEGLKQRRELTWIMKNSGIPAGTETARFNSDPQNVTLGKRATSSSTMDAWFDCNNGVRIVEEVVGLGSYGRTLTVLLNDPLPDPEDEEEQEEENDRENMLPSERWRLPREDR
jgi:Zn-dependent peptidase ImmA (M78 family)